MEISICKYEDVARLNYFAEYENVTIKDSRGSVWFYAKIGSEIVGCVCATQLKRTVRFRGDYVLSDKRKQGIYKELFDFRMNWAIENGFKRATSFCTPSSLHQYRESGFSVIKKKEIKYKIKHYNQSFMTIRFVERQL